MNKIILILCFALAMGNVHADAENKWMKKIEGLHKLKFFHVTKEQILRDWGNPDPNIPEKIKRENVIQYMYLSNDLLSDGKPPYVRFRFDNKDRLIEVSMGFGYGPPSQGKRGSVP
jgi:hypothetical protein